MQSTGLFRALILCLSSFTAVGDVYSVKSFGAAGDGVAKDTAAIQRGIDACADGGGGTVQFSAGVYLAGSLHLRSGVTLSLENGATIKGSRDLSDYDSYEDLGFKNDSDEETSYFHHALIWGEGVERVAIVGQGTIDCNFEQRHGPKAIALKRCRFVTIRDVVVRNCPNYTISLLGTDFVNIDGVSILNGFADGIDPDASQNVRISNCHIETWDDAIVPKASFSLGERRASENITVTNCYLETACNGFKLGTESGGDFKRIAVSNCVISGLRGKRPASGGVCVESVDGSNIDGVVASNLTMVDVRAPIFIRLGNRGRDMVTPVPGSLRNVSIDNVVATGASLTCTVTGIPGHPVEGVSLSGIRIAFNGGCPYRPPDEEIPEQIDQYPDPDIFDALPAYGLFARHVRELTLANVQLNFADSFWRFTADATVKPRWYTESGTPEPVTDGIPGNAVLCDDVEGITMTGLIARPCSFGSPVIRFRGVRSALITGSRALAGTKTFLEVQGERSGGIRVVGNALDEADDLAVANHGASADSFFLAPDQTARRD